MVLPILFLAIIGFASGAILSTVGRLLETKGDDAVDNLFDCLPGINCGACGFPGCKQYAAAIIEKNIAPNQCKPGGEDCVAKISAVLGRSIDVSEPEIAFVHCSGSCSEKYVYVGTASCRASELYYNGKEDCRFGCVGLGDCASVCPEGAIVLKDNRAVVIPQKCIACGLCVKSCPKKIITLQKAKQNVRVMCGSRDSGKTTKAACKSGCLGCGICERKCPLGAIKVRDNLAVIDGTLCDNCGTCVGLCPVKCIYVRRECESE